MVPALAGVALLAVVASALLLAPRFRDELRDRASGKGTASVSGPTPPAQAASATPEEPRPPPPPPPPAPSPGNEICPFDMVYVEGIWCPFVSHRCERYLGPPKAKRRASVDRCERYRNVRICEGRPHELKFCIDRYEYPNLKGVKPAVMVSYRDAARACRAEGKRLCRAMEWIYACEGKYTQPYATGLVRPPDKCNIDRRPKTVNWAALERPLDISGELERLDQRVPSGALEACVSPFGVHDATGNVAEWVINTDGHVHRRPFRSALAGGHAERAVATCRYIDAGHGRDFRSHRAGFRCCADALDGRPRRRLMRKDFRLRKKRPILK
jgi:hypothetical protein